MLTSLIAAWWNVWTRPFTVTFKNEISGQSHLKTLAGLCIAAILGAGLSWIFHKLLYGFEQEFMGLASMWVGRGTPAPFGTWLILVPVGVLYGFYTFEIVLFIFARILSGKGSFRAQSYLHSLFYAPLAIVQQGVAVSPDFGRVLFGLLAVASLIPTTTSLKAAHGYSTGRAVLTWVLPILLNIVVFAGIVILLSWRRQ